MESENRENKIGKLNRDNYQIWKFKVEMLLSKDDLWNFTYDDPPLKPSNEWVQKDRKAKAIIALSVEDDQLTHIRRCNHAKDMWLALKKIHEHGGLSTKLFLLRKLYNSKLAIDGDMQLHLNNIMDLTDKLRDIGESIRDDHIGALILCSLPSTYDNLITALEARPSKDLNLSYIKTKVLEEFNRKKESLVTDKLSTLALKSETSPSLIETDSKYCDYCHKHGHVKKSETSPSLNETDSKYCDYCHKHGHVKKFCFKLRNRKFKHGKKALLESPEIETDEDIHTTKSVTIQETVLDENWYLDSGASTHMCSCKEFFKNFKENSSPIQIFMADGSCIEAQGQGEGYIPCNKIPEKLLIKDVLYVPLLKGNLLSVSKLTTNGFEVIFKDRNATLVRDGKAIINATLKDNIFILQKPYNALISNNQNSSCCIHSWHRKLGHHDIKAIQLLQSKDLATGINITKCKCKEMPCEECIKTKSIRTSLPKKSLNRSKLPFDIIHTDVCGPIQTTTPAGNKYFITFTDDYSRYTEVFPISRKSDAAQIIRQFIEAGKNQFRYKPQIIRCDNGSEYINNELNKYLKDQGIKRQITVPYTPEQNGVAERRNRYLIEMVRVLLLEAKLPQCYWGEAVCTAAYLQNRTPSSTTGHTPYELWYSKKPNLKHLYTFGSKAFYHVPKQLRNKLDNTAKEGILVGYSKPSKGYRILLPDSKRIIISRSVTFIEKGNPQSLENNHSEILPTTIPLKTTSQDTIRRSPRENIGIPPERYGLKTNNTEEIKEPTNYKDLQNLPENEISKWNIAMLEEINSIHENNTWELVKLPIDRKPIGCRWTYKIKRNATGIPFQYKARLVAKGYNQQFGEDYDQIFAPVVKHSTIRLLLTIAGHRKMFTKHLDVKSAFLHGDLREDIYMAQPEGFIQAGNEKLVCKLNKCIYGLKQSAREWNQKINNVLVKDNYIRSQMDPCLYTKAVGDRYTYILLYVDDILICSDMDMAISKAEILLNKHFKMKDLGEIAFYVGLQIDRDTQGIFHIHQKTKIDELIEKFKLSNAKSSFIPMSVEYPKLLKSESSNFDKEDLYRKGVGSLLYLTTTTRPDIATAVGFLSRKVSNPSNADWNALKRTITYLKSTAHLKLKLDMNKNPSLTAYADADWANCAQDRKSTTGFICFLGKSPIEWKSKRQTCVAASSTEAEYVAAASTGQEIKYIRSLLKEIGYEQKDPTVLMEDNQSCISLINNENTSARTKHIDVRYHLIRDYVYQDILTLTYCPTEIMVADTLTKPLPKPRFIQLRTQLGLA